MRSIQILMKPASGYCNMRCRYCFYMDEAKKRSQEYYGMMSEEVLETVIRKAVQEAEYEVNIAYQGGEPTLRGLDFFQKSVELQKKHNTKGLVIHNALQTNGYALDEKWGKFLAEHHFLVGLSIDGIKHTHDKNRIDLEGKGTFAKCMKTVELFHKYDVNYNVLTVVNGQTAPQIRKIYQKYKKYGFRYQQYIPCLDPFQMKGGKQEYSLLPEVYGQFLTELFQMWYDDLKRKKQPYIRMFDNYIGILMGYPPEACEYNGICGDQNAIEADGSVYPCDFYMMDEYCLGNIKEYSFAELKAKKKGMKFVENSCNHSDGCKACEYFLVCRGGCRRHRIMNSATGHAENYFCRGLKMFFDAHFDKMVEIARLMQMNRL